jgi:hypothetical protein
LGGKKTAARKTMEQVQASAAQRYVSSYYHALALLALGEKDTALDWLEKAFEERSGWLVYLNVEPSMDRLRGDPRFEKLARRVKLPEQSLV